MKGLLLGLLLIITVLLEASAFPFFPVFGTEPNLLLGLVLAWQFLGRSPKSYYSALFGGVLTDLVNNTPLGFSSLTLLLISGAVGLVQRFAEGSFPVLLLTTFVSAFILRFVQVFPTFNPFALFKGGILDVGVVAVVYPALRYFLKTFSDKRELIIKT